MALEPINFLRYRYVPKDVVLTLDRNYEFRDGTITYINLVFDYVGSRLPIIQCGIECDSTTIAEIYRHQDIAKMTIALDEQRIDNEDNILGTSPYLRDTFTLIPARDQSVYITDTDTGVEQRTDDLRLLQHFEFYLVDLEKVKWFDAERNFSVANTTFPAIFQSLFIARGIPGNIIVATPPMQDIVLKNVKLPLSTLIGNIKSLNSKYGLYDCNPIVFYDMKYLYCISKREPNTTMPDTATDFGTVTFMLYNPDDQHHKIPGSYDDTVSATHFINLEQVPNIVDLTIRDTYTKTSTVATVDKDGNIDTTSIDDEATKLTYVYQENSLTKAQIMNELITGPTVEVVSKDMSIKVLRPYKAYNFRVDTSYNNLDLAGKTFRLLGYTCNIYREGINQYLSETSMKLYCPVRDNREEPVEE